MRMRAHRACRDIIPDSPCWGEMYPIGFVVRVQDAFWVGERYPIDSHRFTIDSHRFPIDSHRYPKDSHRFCVLISECVMAI